MRLTTSPVMPCSGESNGSAALVTVRAFRATHKSAFAWRSFPPAKRRRGECRIQKQLPFRCILARCPPDPSWWPWSRTAILNAVMIPTPEIIRFYYAPSTRLAQAIFWGEYDETFNAERSGVFEEGVVKVHLRRCNHNGFRLSCK